MPTSVLLLDDDLDAVTILRDLLARQGYDAEAVGSGEAGLASLASHTRDIVVTDLNMTGMTGIEVCRAVRERYPETLAIVLTGAGGLGPAVEAIQAGAFDYLTKPVKSEELRIAVARAADHVGLVRELRRLRDASTAETVAKIGGESPGVVRMLDMISRVAEGDATVLITGESGTGKELVARALHEGSSRRNEPFIAVNCAAMPAPLLESELFGHARGAFTDAHSNRRGLFVQAGKGTLFLDEIGEMPLEMQVKLLRVLQERRVRPVGSDQELDVKARIVTATNRNLEQEVEAKRFREDLYYRVNVVPIAVPPLRDRAGDIMVLAHRFLRDAARRSGKPVRGFTPSAARRLMDYDWPGNVRELENCIERAVAICIHDELTISDLPAKLVGETPPGATDAPALAMDELITIDEMSRRYTRQVLAAMNGNKSHAARVLGIDRRSIYRRLEEKEPATPET